MTSSVVVALSDVAVAPPLPWAGERLTELVLRQMFAADPSGDFTQRDPEVSDAALYLGPNGSGLVAHGAGWDCYYGSAPSPLHTASGQNPFGSGLSAILVVWRLFQFRLDPSSLSFICNALDWREAPAPLGARGPNLADLGEEQIDAALPFLSFAAELMTAAEVTKLAHDCYPYSTNRVFFAGAARTRVVPGVVIAPGRVPLPDPQ